MTRYLELPVVPPNGPQDTWIVDCDPLPAGVTAYPAGTQTHAYVFPGAVEAVLPIPPSDIAFTQRGFSGGCMLYLAYGHIMVTVLSAERVAALLEEFPK